MVHDIVYIYYDNWRKKRALDDAKGELLSGVAPWLLFVCGLCGGNF